MTRSSGPEIAQAATRELQDLLAAVPAERYDAFTDEVLAARRILVYGVGREGLMLRALAMRLMHLGLDAHVVGDMTAPPVHAGDVLITSAGPGHFATVAALLRMAHEAGARTLVVTSRPDVLDVASADTVVALPGPTMTADFNVPASALLMGSLFELVQLTFYDVAVMLIVRRLNLKLSDVVRRHTNLE
jgi:6-phospho-3-hexuloisomerase